MKIYIYREITDTVKRLAKYLLCLLLGILFFSFTAVQAQPREEIMHFPDRNLEAAVRDALGRPTGILTTAHMLELATLEAARREIKDLTGLEKATNLQSLFLYGNRVENLAPLAQLRSLRSLNLYYNRVGDLSPLSGLTRLETLYLGGNRISDLSPLAALTGLKELYLFENRIQEITPLATLRNLNNLNLNDNNIDNFLPLQEMARTLRRLSIRGNRYKDVSFLKPLTGLEYLELGNSNLENINELRGLTRLTHLQVTGSKINDINALAPLLALQWLSLEKNRISNITPLAGLRRLEYLNLNDNWIGNVDALARLQNLGWLEIANNMLDVDSDSPELKIIRGLLERGVTVNFERQLLPRFRGDASVYIPAGASGKLYQSGPQKYFTIINHSLGWRIKSFTVKHVGGKPRDYIREVGRYDMGAGRFAWYATPGRFQPSVAESFPYQVTFHKPSSIQLALSIQTLPGNPADDERIFYVAQVTLYNIHTESSYTIDIKPPDAGEYSSPAPEKSREADKLRIEAID